MSNVFHFNECQKCHRRIFRFLYQAPLWMHFSFSIVDKKIVLKTLIKSIRGVKYRTIERVSKNCGANLILTRHENLLQPLLTHKPAWRFEKKSAFFLGFIS